MTEPCSQQDRIVRLEVAVDKIGEEVSQIASNVNAIKIRMEPVLDMVGGHDRALRGSNGDIGLNAKVANAGDAMEDLALALRGHGQEAGLIADIHSLKKWMTELRDERKWLTRLVIGIVIAEAGGLLFVMLK